MMTERSGSTDILFSSVAFTLVAATAIDDNDDGVTTSPKYGRQTAKKKSVLVLHLIHSCPLESASGISLRLRLVRLPAFDGCIYIYIYISLGKQEDDEDNRGPRECCMLHCGVFCSSVNSWGEWSSAGEDYRNRNVVSQHVSVNVRSGWCWYCCCLSYFCCVFVVIRIVACSLQIYFVFQIE